LVKELEDSEFQLRPGVLAPRGAVASTALPLLVSWKEILPANGAVPPNSSTVAVNLSLPQDPVLESNVAAGYCPPPVVTVSAAEAEELPAWLLVPIKTAL
jgi:hypothetical protein